LSAEAGPGKSHDERIAAAHAAMTEAMAKHGSMLLAVGIYGTTAIGLDVPFSDLDMTFMTRADLGYESTVIVREGLLLNLDYQTWDESVAEARVPELAETWTDLLELRDPDDLFPRLRAIADSLTDEDYFKAFTRKVADDVATILGKIRNAVAFSDRAGFLSACQAYSEAVCRAICLRNRHYVTGQARLREATKQLAILPAGFAALIDNVSGVYLTTGQQAYDAAEQHWARIQIMTG
jgi:hypothetical protein